MWKFTFPTEFEIRKQIQPIFCDIQWYQATLWQEEFFFFTLVSSFWVIIVQRTRQSKQLLFRNALPSNWVSLNCNWPWGFIDQKKNVKPPWTICVITKFVRCHDNREKTQLIRGFHRTFSHRNSITGIIKSAQGLLKQIKALMYFGGDDTCNGEVALICFTIESLETIPPMASEINTECEKIVA